MDHIHTHYALKEFKYLVFVFGEVLEKQVLEKPIWKNTVFILSQNFQVTKIVQIICNMP